MLFMHVYIIYLYIHTYVYKYICRHTHIHMQSHAVQLIPLLGIYLRLMKVLCKDLRMDICGSFVCSSQILKLPKYTSGDERTSTLGCVSTVERGSSVKRDTIVMRVTTWGDFTITALSEEVRQESILPDFSFMKFQKRQTSLSVLAESRTALTWRWEGRSTWEISKDEVLRVMKYSLPWRWW